MSENPNTILNTEVQFANTGETASLHICSDDACDKPTLSRNL